jgi:hypothetical protein
MSGPVTAAKQAGKATLIKALAEDPDDLEQWEFWLSDACVSRLAEEDMILFRLHDCGNPTGVLTVPRVPHDRFAW